MRRIASALCLASLALPAATAEDDGRVHVTPLAIGRACIAVSAPAGADFDARTTAALRLKVACAFEDADIETVAAFFHKATGVNIVLSPEARLAEQAITLTVQEMTADTALRWAVRQGGLHMGFLDEAIYIDVAPVRGPRTVRIYEVGDLVSPVRDFPGPELALNAKGVDIRFPVVPAEEPRFTVEDLAELIEELYE